MFPPIPPWDGLHPLIVHFPIALLLVAPVLVLLGLVVRPYSRGLLAGALTLMLLGTAGAWVAVETGEAAAQLADRTPEITTTLQRHQELAETTRTVFTLLAALFAVLFFAPVVLRKDWKPALVYTSHGLFLAFYLAGMLVLANTAHAGGTLVHEHGVRAMISSAPVEADAP